MITIQQLSKVYINTSRISLQRNNRQTVAVDKLDLEIDDGRVFGLLGVNGAGKTTIVKILATLLEPTFGRVSVGGFDVVRQANDVRKIVNMIAGGERMLYWRLTGRENLEYFADMYNVDVNIKKKRVDELLELVGLNESANKRVEQYSKGMKQRLQIARGLINNPQYVLMDEPTIGLDAPIAREIRELIKNRLNKTVLFTSHYMAEVEELCSWVAIIHKGRLVTQGTISDLKQEYSKSHILLLSVTAQSEELDCLLETFKNSFKANIKAQTTNQAYQIKIETEQNVNSKLIDAINASGQRIIELQVIEPTLEEVLITISKGEREI